MSGDSGGGLMASVATGSDFVHDVNEPLNLSPSYALSDAPVDVGVLKDWKKYKQRMLLRRVGAALFTVLVVVAVPLSIVFMIMKKHFGL